MKERGRDEISEHRFKQCRDFFINYAGHRLAAINEAMRSLKRSIVMAWLICMTLCLVGCSSLSPKPSFPASPADPGYAGATIPGGEALFLTELTACIAWILAWVFLCK